MAGDGNFFWWWATGSDSEPETYNGPCATRDEAIAEARGNDGEELGFVIVEADRAVPSNEIFDVDYVMERYEECNEECWGEDGMDLDVTNEQGRDLEKMLAETFDAWFKKHGIGRCGWCFETMRNQETFQPTVAEVG